MRLERPASLLARARAWLRDEHVLAPADSVLRRTIGAARHKARTLLTQRMAERLSAPMRDRLDALIAVDDDQPHSSLNRIKASSSSPSVGGMKRLLARLELIEATGVLGVDVGWVNGNYQRILFHSVRTASADRVRRMAAPRRHLALVCFLHQAWRDTLDQAVDMYGKLLDRNRKRVEDRLDDMLKAQRHAVDRIVQRYRRLRAGAVLLDPDVGAEVDRAKRAQIARLREDAELAQRQFLLVRPENRLVADSLERHWNEALQRLAAAEEAYAGTGKTQLSPVTSEMKERVAALVADLPRVWHDPRTPARDRKRMLRLLVEDVTLLRDDVIRVSIRWRGGATREIECPLPLAAPDLRRTPAAVVEQVRALATEQTDAQIADTLNGRWLRTGAGLPFSRLRVRMLREVYDIDSYAEHLLGARWLTVPQMAELLDVHPATAKRFAHQGVLRAVRADDKGTILFEPPTGPLPAAHPGKRLRDRQEHPKLVSHVHCCCWYFNLNELNDGPEDRQVSRFAQFYVTADNADPCGSRSTSSVASSCASPATARQHAIGVTLAHTRRSPRAAPRRPRRGAQSPAARQPAPAPRSSRPLPLADDTSRSAGRTGTKCSRCTRGGWPRRCRRCGPRSGHPLRGRDVRMYQAGRPGSRVGDVLRLECGCSPESGAGDHHRRSTAGANSGPGGKSPWTLTSSHLTGFAS